MRHALTALALILPMPALAQTAGSIDGALDARQVSYEIVDTADNQTGWTQTDEGIEVTIEAYPADSPPDAENRLLVTFTADAATRMPELLSARVEMGDGDGTLTAADDEIALTLQSFEVVKESLTVIGGIRVTLAPREAGDVGVLSDDGQTLSANIQATLINEEM